MRSLNRLRPKMSAILLIIIAGATLVPSIGGHAAAGEVLVPGQWRDLDPGPHALDVVLALDEEWRDVHGPDAERDAQEVLDIASANLAEAGLLLRLDEVTEWSSDDDVPNIHPLLGDIRSAFSSDGPRLVIALTAASYSEAVDGVARARVPYVVVRHHEDNLKRDAYVLTHEIGHVFGLDHHTCEDELCFMADHGYDPDEHWCDEHRDLLSDNAGYFHYIQTAEDDV